MGSNLRLERKRKGGEAKASPFFHATNWPRRGRPGTLLRKIITLPFMWITCGKYLTYCSSKMVLTTAPYMIDLSCKVNY